MSSEADERYVTQAKVIGVLVLFAVVIFLVWLLWLNHVTGVVREVLLPPAGQAASTPDANTVLAQLGQAGDAFGSLNALFAGLAAALVAAAAYLQNLQLQQARRAYDEERRSRLKLEFESTFFKLLDLSRELTERVEAKSVAPRADIDDLTKHGAAALDFMASGLLKFAMHQHSDSPAAQASFLVHLYIMRVYGRQPSSLGPYFRLLFQLFKVIDESSLDEQTKVRYANIVRGQISEGAVFLLALNGLTSRGFKFVYFIEKFGLLEHMHGTCKRIYRSALLPGYRERAFLGSKKRAELPLHTSSLNPPDHIESDRQMRRAVVRKLEDEKWPRLSEQLSPIYKWTAGGLQTVQSCPRWRSALATNRPPRWATRGAPWNSSYAAIATLGSLAK
jgi:hypothetical protein